MKALLQCWTGRTAVADVAREMREAGLIVQYEGSDHVHVESEGSTPEGAAWNLLVDLNHKHGTDMGLRPVFLRWLPPEAGSFSDVKAEAFYRLVQTVKEALVAYDKSGDHTKHAPTETDCVRCKLVSALGPWWKGDH